MSIVTSKSIFNTNGCILDDRRSCLYSNTLKVLCVKKNWVMPYFETQNYKAKNIFEDFYNLHI